MKENGNKLIELLNEFMEEKKSSYRFTEIINDGDFFYTDKTYGINQDGLGYETIISKKFGFIKWLVENDKLGDNKDSQRYSMMKLMRAEINEGTGVFEGTERYEFVIMILSIQENPITFLISILR